MVIDIWHIYFNGEFYYSAQDTHYKHGHKIETHYSEFDAREACERLNSAIWQIND